MLKVDPLPILSMCLALLAPVMARAQSEAAPAGQVVSLRAERLPDQADQRIPAVAARAVLQVFQQRHPEIKLEPFIMPQVNNATSFDSGPLMAIAAGVPPHILYVNCRRSSTYIAQNFLEPQEILLARILSADPRVRQADARGRWLADPSADEIASAIAQIKARSPEPFWPVIYRENDEHPEKGRHVWAMPKTNLVIALLYRKDLFYEAGLDPERGPRDWDEMLAFARKLTVPERQQYGLGLSSVTMAWSTYSFVSSNGGRAVERDPATGQWRAVYGSDAAASAVEFVWRLVHEPWIRPSDGKRISGAAMLYSGSMKIPWNRRQLGMMFSYLDEELMADINPQTVGVAPVPASPKGTRASEVNGEMLGIYTGCTPEQKLAAMRYVWFVTGDEAKRIRTNTYVDGGYGMFTSPELLRRFGYEEVLARVPKEWTNVFDIAMSHGVPEPYGKNTNSVWRYMSMPIDEAMELPLGSMTPKQAHATVKKLMSESAEEVNRKLLGIIPPAEMHRRRTVALAVMLAVVAAFFFGMMHVWRYFGRMARASRGGESAAGRAGRRKFALYGYALLLPALLVVLWWQYLPLTGAAAIAGMDYQLAQASHWVWLDNFAAALFDEKFWGGFARTFYFVFLLIGLGFWPPILLAILLQEIPTEPAKYIFRVVYYLPAVISGVIVMFLWRQLYEPSERGILNQIIMSVNLLGPVAATALKWLLLAAWLALIWVAIRLPMRLTELSRVMKASLGLLAAGLIAALLWTIAQVGSGALIGRFHVPPLRWIASPEMAMLCVVIPMIWAASGSGSILYLAALKNIPEELYEAADIDGASHWHKVFYIVLPRLKFLLVIQFIAAVIGAFKGGTDYILALTGGGPNDATTVLALEIFLRAFMDLKFGVAAAMAWVLGALLIGFTAYQLKLLSRAEFRAGG